MKKHNNSNHSGIYELFLIFRFCCFSLAHNFIVKKVKEIRNKTHKSRTSDNLSLIVSLCTHFADSFEVHLLSLLADNAAERVHKSKRL